MKGERTAEARTAQIAELFGASALFVAVLTLFLSVSLRQLHGRDAFPQVVRGDGALAVAFGDAREVLGRAMVQKADSYFHGGIDMDCHEAHGDEHRHHDENCEHHDHHDGDEAEAQDEHEEHGGSFDPWRWINSRVRAPRVHRHLEGEKSVELIPWLWASVKADPHNIDAWTTAAYVAGDMMKDRELALRILSEGEARNPGSALLRYYKGRVLYARGKGDVTAAKSTFATARDIALLKCGGRPDRLSEEDRRAYDFSTNFIAGIERREAGK